MQKRTKTIHDIRARCVVDDNGCWLWQAYRNPAGYGWVTVRGSTSGLAHRVAWALVNGEIPEKALVLHNCFVKHCVNPAHLRLGNHKDNANDPDIVGLRRWNATVPFHVVQETIRRHKAGGITYHSLAADLKQRCLLYTSDAADE